MVQNVQKEKKIYLYEKKPKSNKISVFSKIKYAELYSLCK